MPFAVPFKIHLLKILIFWSFILLLSTEALPQKTLLLEKVGARRKFFFKAEDKFMLRTYKPDTLLRGRLWDIADNDIILQTYIPLTIQYPNIKYVYQNYTFPLKFGVYCMAFGGVTAIAITINHLLNNEQVFTPDMAYLCLPFIGAGIISISLSRERMKIGPRWKLKVLDMPVFPLYGK
ncbi:MAG: hypothetical protein NTW31_13930 [Bacteroidetes bacterium]|nr:hypothetical protein [Bacteroidota bacterium]